VAGGLETGDELKLRHKLPLGSFPSRETAKKRENRERPLPPGKDMKRLQMESLIQAFKRPILLADGQ
ncbi:MAG: hypothetical protein JWQ69_137, partial [Pseudomonas sp.]|nr:hypothetical protein [Pseudomonas sp.]